MHEVDSPDFNKARGFLIGYSLVVLLLWFFGADLTKFKLMGNEIDLHRNIQHVWAVIAVVNVYLWFRFFQRLPKRGLKFDEKMHELLDECLISVCRLRHKREAFKQEEKSMAKDDGSKLHRLAMTGEMPYRAVMEKMKGIQENSGIEPWEYSFPQRAEVDFRLTRYSKHFGRVATTTGGNSYSVIPNRTLYRLIVAYAFLKGVFCRSWFTDNIWPLIFGLISTTVALIKWW